MRARASSLNYRDLMVLKGGGRGPTKIGVVPLSDGAGEVATIGDGVTRVKLGSGGGGSGGPVTISGNFQCTGNSGNCSAVGGSVRGNVLVDNNTSVGKQGAVVAFNDIGGNVQVDNNVGDLNTDVSGNTIGGNLACAGNTPGVKTDPANTVGGNKQGQCAGL
jgi:hypothetical protein